MAEVAVAVVTGKWKEPEAVEVMEGKGRPVAGLVSATEVEVGREKMVVGELRKESEGKGREATEDSETMEEMEEMADLETMEEMEEEAIVAMGNQMVERVAKRTSKSLKKYLFLQLV